MKRVIALLSALLLFGCAGNFHKQNDVINIGVRSDVPLTAYYDYSGSRAGTEIEIAKGLSDFLGMKPHFVTVTSLTREKMLKNGDIDILIATYSITKDRKKTVSFSKAYKIDHQGVMVKNKKTLEKTSDLSGKRIGVVKGANSGKKLKSSFEKITLVYFDTYYRAMMALSLGDVDGISSDKSILNGLIALWSSKKKKFTKYHGESTYLIDVQNMNKKSGLYKVLPANLSDEYYGVAVAKKNKGLLKKVNQYLDSCCLRGLAK